MSYKQKPQLKLYKYVDSAFVLQAIIDDYQEASWENNLYEAGTFSVTINYNIPNAQKFERGLFINFGDSYEFGEILTISDAIGSDGKSSQIRTITGKDARYILKRRVIKNMNDNGKWSMTAKGELCLRNLVKDQCGSGAETKRRLPITNVIPNVSGAIGNVYSVSESFSNLYEVCKTIATQSEIGWRIEFDGTNLNLVCFNGTDRSTTVQFSTSYDSLANGTFTDTSESYANSIYVGGKGQNDDRDIYEGEVTGTPSGLDRYECWDNQSSMTTEDEYEAEAISMLTQYGQTIQLSGQGLAKCPYVYEEQYFVGDKITVAFSGKSAVVQILSVTEHWSWNNYDIQFSFGKPQNNLSDQLQIMLRKIQEASNKTNSKDSIRWYTIPTELEMPKGDVTYNTIGFIGDASTGETFKLYFGNSGTGSKTYHVYFKQLAGSGKLTLTTGVTGAQNLVLDTGTYVVIIYVDENGNIVNQASTPVSAPIVNSSQPITSGGVANYVPTYVTDRLQNFRFHYQYLVGGTGYTRYVLLYDVTDWYNNMTPETVQYHYRFEALFFFWRNGYINNAPFVISASVSYARLGNNFPNLFSSIKCKNLLDTTIVLKSCIIKIGDKYYTAIKNDPDTVWDKMLEIMYITNEGMTPLFQNYNASDATEIYVSP